MRCVVTLVLLFTAIIAHADDASFQFQWRAGQELTYKVVQSSTVNETIPHEKTGKPMSIITVTKLTLTKKWNVKSVDNAGVATIELTTTAMRQDVTQTVDTGKPVVRVLDSANPEDAKLMTFLNKPILTVNMDRTGRLSDVKSENPDANNRLQADLPFKVVVPEKFPDVGGAWNRAFELKLATGDKFDAKQTFTHKGHKDGMVVVGMVTSLNKPLGDPALMPAVAPVLWQGDLFLDPKKGHYHGAKLTITQEAKNHQGEGSSFRYTSDYAEVLEK